MADRRKFGAIFRLMLPVVLGGGATMFCAMFILAIAVGKSSHEAGVYGTTCGVAIMFTTIVCMWMTYHLDRSLG